MAMTQNEINILNYIVVCVSEYASRNKLNARDAYLYLQKNRGIEFLKEFYDVERTLSFDDVISDLNSICSQNGGAM